MDRATARALDGINRRFYERSARDFDATRGRPWQGWRPLLAAVERLLPPGPLEVLDAGCGNGRFGRFLGDHSSRSLGYLGLDRSLPLLAAAHQRLGTLRGSMRLVCADLLSSLLEDRGLAPLAPGLERFHLVALFGVLHHVPAASLRRRLLCDLARRLAPGGLLAVSVWRYGDDPRFRARILPWQVLDPGLAPGLSLAELEAGDHLLAWGEAPGSYRYCHHLETRELEAIDAELARQGLVPAAAFDADGRSGDLNHYLLWRRQG